MTAVVAHVCGIVVLCGCTIYYGERIRKCLRRIDARTSLQRNRWMRRVCLGLPFVIGLMHPGLTQYDAQLGLTLWTLPGSSAAVGLPIVLSGLLLYVSALRQDAAWRKRAQRASIFKAPRGPLRRRIRHPKSVGFYLGCVGAGLIAGSTSVTAGSAFFLIPIHAWNVHHVEERALECLYGSSYASYRRRTPAVVPRA